MGNKIKTYGHRIGILLEILMVVLLVFNITRYCKYEECYYCSIGILSDDEISELLEKYDEEEIFYNALEWKNANNSLDIDFALVIVIPLITLIVQGFGEIVENTEKIANKGLENLNSEGTYISEKNVKQDKEYTVKNIKVKNPDIDGNISVHKLLVSTSENSEYLYVALGGMYKSSRKIEAIKLQLSIMSPFDSEIIKTDAEFYKINKNGVMFVTEYVKLQKPACEITTDYGAELKLINIIADGKKLYGM